MFWLDTTILATLGIGAGLGFWSGMLWQVARVLSLAVSLYLTVTLNGPATEALGQHVLQGSDPRLTRGAAYLAVFLASFILFFLLTRLVDGAIRAARLEMFDRLLGALLGAAKMAVVVAGVCSVLAAMTTPTTREWMEQSTLAPLFARGTEAAIALVPDVYRAQAGETVGQMRGMLQRQAMEQAIDAAAQGN